MNKSYLIAVSAATITLQCSAANASISLSTGSGSAVSVVQATANFDSTSSLTDNPYVENGISFSRTGLSDNNNGCGYAGCAEYFPGFSGNFMYGTGVGYFEIATTGAAFSGLEFVVGSGFGGESVSVAWEAFLGGLSVGRGSTVQSSGTVLGFSGPGGFDKLRYTDSDTYNAPAFDSVAVQYSAGGTVPEPASWALMIGGFALTGFAMRRRSAIVTA